MQLEIMQSIRSTAIAVKGYMTAEIWNARAFFSAIPVDTARTWKKILSERGLIPISHTSAYTAVTSTLQSRNNVGGTAGKINRRITI